MPVADSTHATQTIAQPAADQPPAVQPGTAAWSDLLQGTNGVLALALTGGVALYAVNMHIDRIKRHATGQGQRKDTVRALQQVAPGGGARLNCGWLIGGRLSDGLRGVGGIGYRHGLSLTSTVRPLKPNIKTLACILG